MAPDALTLCYHAVSEDWKAHLAIAPARLEEHLTLLRDRGYAAASFEDVALGRTAGRAVAVTFDDAFTSVIDLALPIFTRLGMTGTVFVPTDYPDSGRAMAWRGLGRWVGTPHEHELGCMSWDQLRELRDRGWEIASHTCSHPVLTELPDDALRDELARSREVCAEQMGAPSPTLAYPYGDHDPRVVAEAARAGYSAAGTLSGRFVRNAPLQAPRIGVYEFDTPGRFRLKALPLTRRVRSSRAWARLDALRSGSSPPPPA
jgi:peptidoglycan/xylan/chitin deacetylase (PgdA/CDA1 family)